MDCQILEEENELVLELKVSMRFLCETSDNQLEFARIKYKNLNRNKNEFNKILISPYFFEILDI